MQEVVKTRVRTTIHPSRSDKSHIGVFPTLLPKSILTKRVDLGTFGENFQRSQNDHMTSLGHIEMFLRAFENLLHLSGMIFDP